MSEPKSVSEFPRYERALWRVLATLARSGYFVPPNDARDLLHDFYVDSWSGLHARFDPGLSSFSTYVCAAFYRYARRRLVNLESWRHKLVDLDEASALASPTRTPQETLERSQLLSVIRDALSRLPPQERQLLYDHLSDPPVPERVLADRIGLTRYAVRELLIDAVGRLAVELKASASDSKESLVAFYLWRDGRTPKQVSSLLGIPTAEIQACRSRIASELLSSIRSADSATRQLEGKTVNKPSIEQLKGALLAADAGVSESFIVANVDFYRELLEQDIEFKFSEEEERFLDAHPERLSALYEALGLEEEDDHEEPTDVLRALAAARRNADREVGEAFGGLVDNLPETLRDWERWFAKARPDGEFVKFLSRDLSVTHTSQEAKELVRYGLTPTLVHDATVAIQLLLDRMERLSERTGKTTFAGQRDDSASGYFVAQYSNEHRVRIHGDYFIAQVTGVRDMHAGMAPVLTAWLLEAAQSFPFLFEGYCVDSEARQGLTFMRYHLGKQREDVDLLARWTKRVRARALPRFQESH